MAGALGLGVEVKQKSAEQLGGDTGTHQRNHHWRHPPEASTGLTRGSLPSWWPKSFAYIIFSFPSVFQGVIDESLQYSEASPMGVATNCLPSHYKLIQIG